MNQKQFEIWKNQKWKEYDINLRKLQDNFASRGLALSGMRNQAEKDLKEKYNNEIKIARLGIKRSGPNWQMLSVIVSVASIIIGIFIFRPEPMIEQTGSINTVGQSGGTNLVVNEQAKYVWINEKTWKAEMQDNGSGKYQVNMVFTVDGPVVPVTPCLHISSDAEIISSGPIGASLHLSKESTPNSLTQCFGGLASTAIFQTFFKGEPKEIKATLVESEKELDINRGESKFTVPVR